MVIPKKYLWQKGTSDSVDGIPISARARSRILWCDRYLNQTNTGIDKKERACTAARVVRGDK